MTVTTRKFRDSDELHEVAIRDTGLDNFGDPRYRDGLHVLLDAFDNDVRLSVSTWQAAHREILDILISRLYAEKGWAAHPDVLKIPIHGPLVITGLPRTGTTALHKLISMDPQFQGLEYWLSATPMIRPPCDTWETRPEYQACVANLEALYAGLPEARKAHEVLAHEVEECGIALLQNFVSTAWSVWNLPTYAGWVLEKSRKESYGRYADVLRLIGARESHKRWLLKDPYHLAEIDILLEVFPDACIIQTHRDPLKAIPSMCNVLQMFRQDMAGEATLIGPRQCTYWRNALDRAQAAYKRLPRNFFNVDHRAFLKDPIGTVHSIYRFFGLTLSQGAEQQMLGWVAASPTSRHGPHRYAADTWGLTTTEISEIFSDYRARHQFE